MSARRRLFAAVLTFSALATSASGQVSGAPEFQANTYTTNAQEQPAVCTTKDGGFVAVWNSVGQDGDEDGIFGQRFASTGDPLGTEFQVNAYTGDEQFGPSVCCGAAGNFTVVWTSTHDGEQTGVFAHRFASSGSSLGGDFQVNTYTTEAQYGAKVCCDAASDFVVAWISYGQEDQFFHGIFAQRFASNGSSTGTEFQVNTYTIDSQFAPSLCCDAIGSFVVTWESELQDGEFDGVFARRFASGGSAVGTEFQVNTYTVGDNEDPAVCCDATGSFVVSFESSDGSGIGAFARRFGGDGGPRGREFLVNSYTIERQSNPSVCCDPDGSFAVAWNSDDQVPGGGEDIFAQRFANDGSAAGGEFQVNTYTLEDQYVPAAACAANDAFVVVWQSARQDGSGNGVFGRRFASLLPPTATPVLSWLGLGAVVAGLLWTGSATLRRRRGARR
jgi:hypothetical protein